MKRALDRAKYAGGVIEFSGLELDMQSRKRFESNQPKEYAQRGNVAGSVEEWL
jgi:hypothetical protein